MIHLGDCRDTMRRLIAEGVKVQMCVTSPPYWGLRDYGVAGQLGLESTPQEYVANMVEVFRLVRELLADDGTLWLNLGDSYAAQRGGTQMPAETLAGGIGGHAEFPDAYRGRRSNDGPDSMDREAGAQNKAGIAHRNASTIGLKHKDLVGIPWRVAFALQADGWYLRQDIIWSKPNPMPESVRDRCTKSHEYIFLLSKRERYYFDCEAIAEPAICGDPRKPFAPGQIDARGDGHDRGGGKIRESVKRGGFNGKTNALQGREAFRAVEDWRNKRSVWTVATQPYAEAHFATFPPALIEPCILAGSRPGDTVLDPFFGSGTVGEVAENLGRKWIGCELNPDYIKLANKRTAQQGMVLA